MSPTYTRRRQASPPLQTSCFSSTNSSLTSIADRLLLKHKLNGAFFERYVPNIRPQATSLTSIADRLLLKHKTQWSLFQALCLRTYTYKIQ
ncbi:hypothetical protein ACE6H2_023046 [Prunus campanulata]